MGHRRCGRRRPTVRTLLTGHDVHVLDWENARDIPAHHGPFGLDEYVDHVVQALRYLGPDTHVVAVCQPAVPVLAAVSLLAAENDRAQPSSHTLIAGSVDTRVNPGRVSERAATTPLSVFERWLTDTVPARYAGAGRRVYPGAAQLTAFMSMDPKRHLGANARLHRAPVAGDTEGAARTRASTTSTAPSWTSPPSSTWRRCAASSGTTTSPAARLAGVAGRCPRPPSGRRPLFRVQGRRRHVPSRQTRAAHDLCTGIPAERGRHHVQAGVGHYGVFAGSRWENEIHPMITAFIAENAAVHPTAGVP